MTVNNSADLKNRLSERQSNFELLRIFTMIAIVANHFASHGGFDFESGSITANVLWLQFIKLGGKIGVDVFVLISGYFSISSQKSITKKAVKMWLQIFTYSVCAFIFFTLAGAQKFSVKEAVRHLFPVTFSHWWFASVFFVLLLFLPYINKFLTSLDRKSYKRMLAVMCVCWCVIPTFTSQFMQGNNLLWFLFLYLFAAYVRLYDPFADVKKTKLFLFAFILIVMSFASAVILNFAGTKIPFARSHQFYFYGMQKLNIFIISVLLLTGFSKIDIGKNRLINTVASATFGVYLIHDEAYIRQFLWEKAVRASDYAQSKLLVLYSAAVILLVFACCTLIELARIRVLEKHYMKAVGRLAEKFD